ncbi:hypothetical protein DL96DRAFT_1820653 [Flagelloscypha sp. PMI_526]|nr:hypothetical protein DL96DRAFT_1820653 [Flagelloscypha sp. PMI_526]
MTEALNKPSSSAPIPILPTDGDFIAFWINPSATLSEYTVNLTEKPGLSEISSRKYAGYIHSLDEGLVFDETETPLTYNVQWIRPGTPIGYQKQEFLPRMCQPIAPNTDHPIGRAALPVSKPLPWPNCYQYSIHGELKVKLWARRTDEIPPYRVDVGDMARGQIFMSKDGVEFDVALNARGGQLVEVDPKKLSTELPVSLMAAYEDDEPVMVVDYTFDLESVKEVSDISQFFRDALKVQELGEELKKSAIEAAQRADAEAYESLGVANHVAEYSKSKPQKSLARRTTNGAKKKFNRLLKRVRRSDFFIIRIFLPSSSKNTKGTSST